MLGKFEYTLPALPAVLPARSWEMPVKCELPAKIGRCSEKLLGHNFDRRAKSSWEKIFIYVKNFLSGGFCSKVKIVACQVFGTPPYFCWQLAFYRHLPTSGRQNTVKKAPQPLFAQKVFAPLCIYPAFHLLCTITISLFLFELQAEFWKAYASAVNFCYLETILAHPTRR